MPWDDMLDEMVNLAGDSAPPPKEERVMPQAPPRPATPPEWRNVKLRAKLRRKAGGECVLIGYGFTHATVRFPTGKRYKLEVETLYRCYTPV